MAKPPPIGQLRNLATIFAWKDLPTAGGQALPTYARVGQAWCAVNPSLGHVVLSGGVGVTEAGTDIVVMRYREDLTHEHVLEVKGQRFRINRVLPDDRRRFVVCHCELYGDQDQIALPELRGDWDNGASTWDDGQSQWDRSTAWDDSASIWDNGQSLWDGQPRA